ncbi:cytochrome oxidase small assembly protein [Rhodoferax sp.]|nr:cytochrome oxidase small assembly protein [Rhodoferax sp.]
MSDEQRRANRRTGLILASIAVLFFFGFMARMVILGG